jgi:hypothetical protein
MKKIILFGLPAIFLIVILALFYLTRPGGDLDRYAPYQVNDTGRPADGIDFVLLQGTHSILLFD